MREPWYHHKYGYVYGHEIPEHIKDAKVGAVKKGKMTRLCDFWA